MERLPKVIVISLDELCVNEKLASWNISASAGMTTVTMRFVGDSHIASSPVPGLRKKSPAQLRRDYNRNTIWQSTPVKETSNVTVQTEMCSVQNDEVCDNSVDIDESSHMQMSDENDIDISPELAQPCESTQSKQSVDLPCKGNEHDQNATSDHTPTMEVLVDNSVSSILEEVHQVGIYNNIRVLLTQPRRFFIP